MTRPPVAPLKHILALGRPDWDRPETRPAVREAFAKVLDCGTAALGAEVFTSAHTTRVVYHTCKCRACPVAATGPRHSGSASSGGHSPTSPMPMSPSRCRTCSGQSSSTTGSCSMTCRC